MLSKRRKYTLKFGLVQRVLDVPLSCPIHHQHNLLSRASLTSVALCGVDQKQNMNSELLLYIFSVPLKQ